jgi:outer membrane protein assembly factor BamE (lipoprotein component of BamABCDE complex)
MKKSKLFCFIFVVVALLVVSFPLNAQSKRARKFVVSFDRFGSVKIGMTASQAAKILGVRVTRDAGYEGGSCYYTSPKRGFKDIAFMMSGRRIARIDINSKEYATDRGAKIGDTEARIKRLYKGKYKVYEHKYVDDAHYIEVMMKGGKYSIIFETDGKRVVTYRVGRPEQVGYVEGCS